MKDAETLPACTISDPEIITRVLRGEKEFYAHIIRRYNQRLYRIGMSILNDDAEVEDIMQVTYINAYENLGKFEFRSSFGTWLTRIMINECLRRAKKQKNSFLVSDDTMNNTSYQQYFTDAQTPASKLLHAELKVILENAIQQLPEKYRTVFIMREIENMSVAETQECLDITESNVKVRLNRARTLLRNTLSSHYKKEELLHFHLSRCNRMVDRVMSGLH